MNDFVEKAMEEGFSRKQAEFMNIALAKYPHTHDIEEVNGLEEELEELGGEDDEEEEGESV